MFGMYSHFAWNGPFSLILDRGFDVFDQYVSIGVVLLKVGMQGEAQDYKG